MNEVEREAVAWCEDCFDDTPEDVTGAEALDCVRRQYPGGLARFVAECVVAS